MKKTVLFFTLIVCIVFLLCCCTPAPVEPDDPDTDPDELSEESAFELPEPAVRTSSLSYEESFSVERPISSHELDNGFFVGPDMFGQRYSDGIYYYVTNSTNGIYYNLITDTVQPAILGYNAYKLYVIEDDYQRIIELSYDASEQSVIYTSEGRIDNLLVYEDVLFFREGSSICRLYIPTGDVDVLLTSEHILDKQYAVQTWRFRYDPISTTDFSWDIPDPAWYNTDFDGDGIRTDAFM